MAQTQREITEILEAWSGGDLSALDRLLPLVFDDLHRLARFFFQRESKTHTLQPTALISEVYFRLRGHRKLDFDGRADFFAFAAELMRHFLVDYGRRRSAVKRGGGRQDLPLELADVLSTGISGAHLLDLHLALEELEAIAPRRARVVELKHFLGLQINEIAELLEVSDTTVKKDWRLAKLWLRRRLDATEEDRRAAPGERGIEGSRPRSSPR